MSPAEIGGLCAQVMRDACASYAWCPGKMPNRVCARYVWTTGRKTGYPQGCVDNVRKICVDNFAFAMCAGYACAVGLAVPHGLPELAGEEAVGRFVSAMCEPDTACASYACVAVCARYAQSGGCVRLLCVVARSGVRLLCVPRSVACADYAQPAGVLELRHRDRTDRLGRAPPNRCAPSECAQDMRTCASSARAQAMRTGRGVAERLLKRGTSAVFQAAAVCAPIMRANSVAAVRMSCAQRGRRCPDLHGSGPFAGFGGVATCHVRKLCVDVV